MRMILLLMGLLVGPWLVATLLRRANLARVDPRGAGAGGLALLFAFTGLGHFVKTQEMATMLPPSWPAREGLVLASGVFEFLLAAGLLWPRTRRTAGWAALAALVLFFPVNVYAAVHHVGMGDHVTGPSYLWVRGPAQLAMALWAWHFAIRAPLARRMAED